MLQMFYENKNSYSFNIVATDDGAGALTGTKAVTITINDLNDPPVISSGSTGTIAENAATSTVVYDAAASDPDTGDTINFSISGTNAALFTIDSDDGETFELDWKCKCENCLKWKRAISSLFTTAEGIHWVCGPAIVAV